MFRFNLSLMNLAFIPALTEKLEMSPILTSLAPVVPVEILVGSKTVKLANRDTFSKILVSPTN